MISHNDNNLPLASSSSSPSSPSLSSSLSSLALSSLSSATVKATTTASTEAITSLTPTTTPPPLQATIATTTALTLSTRRKTRPLLRTLTSTSSPLSNFSSSSLKISKIYRTPSLPLSLSTLSSLAPSSLSYCSSSFQLIMPKNEPAIRLCCVIIVDERAVINTNQTEHVNYVLLGSIIIDEEISTCEDLRRLINDQVRNAPKNFDFLSREGWPLTKKQEIKLRPEDIIGDRNVIAIKKYFDKPRVGVVLSNGECIGSIFINYNSTLSESRILIDEIIKDYDISKHSNSFEYRFVDKHGWPVIYTQENLLTIHDTLSNQNICIRPRLNNPISTSCPAIQVIQDEDEIRLSLPNPQDSLIVSNKQPCISSTDENMGDGWRRRSRKSLIKRPTFSRKNKNSDLKTKKSKLGAKHIMISYARQEAFQHALYLKAELVSYGFSVYLDVDEIRTGTDWQDALNYAVSNCEVFVPLVTNMYGKTLWTNREVKLADLLKKQIVPINFLDSWPPECLAIQFATTQYIPWRPVESEHESIADQLWPTSIKQWPNIYIKRVAKQIAELIPTANVNRSFTFMEQTDKRLIVISAHPSQSQLTQQIKLSLEESNFQVWTSNDLNDDNNSLPQTPNNLPTIPEGNETVFKEAYRDLARKIVESKRPMSLPIDSDQINIINTKTLKRQISTLSDISRLSSINPDKIEKLKSFQDKVQTAGVVIIIASHEYFKSRTSQQHVYYCEHRKEMILVRCDDCPIPSWFNMLCGDELSLNANSNRFVDVLKGRINRILDPSSKRDDKELQKSKILYLLNYMKKNLPILDSCVYVVGSSKIIDSRSDLICKAIGRELTKVTNVTVVTSGFFGVGDVLAKAFLEQKQKNGIPYKVKASTNQFQSSVVHILPIKDSKDFSDKCKQLSDGTFEILSYGDTLFLGESMKERDTAVARLLNTCLLIEGGPGAAHEAQEFAWNDHYVIPIASTGGAASGHFGTPMQIFERPMGVNASDWSILEDKTASPEAVAKSVVKIIMTVKDSIASHYLNSQKQAKTQQKNKTKKCKKKLQKNLNETLDFYTALGSLKLTNKKEEVKNKMIPIIEQIDLRCKESKWKRMQKMIKFNGKK